MAPTAEVLANIQRIYDAALTPNGWESALQSVVDLVGGDHAILVARKPESHDAALTSCIGMAESDFARFLSPHATRCMEPFRRSLPCGSAATWSSLISDREFERTEFYNDVVRSVHGFYAVAFRDEASDLHSFVAVCRGRNGGDFEQTDTTVMQNLSRHLATALRVRQRLSAADLSAASAWAALDRIGTGALIVDESGNIKFVNDAASSLFCEGRLRIDREGLCAPNPNAPAELHRLIANATVSEGTHRTIEIPRGEGLPPLSATITPFSPECIGFEDVGRLSLVLITDPSQDHRRRKERLRCKFGLTDAEAHVALEIARGDGRKAAALRLGIAATTVRTHLTHVFEKTGVHRQAELVRLVLQTSL